eukprot:4237753-Ditylum_brightwellii.AAC.1
MLIGKLIDMPWVQKYWEKIGSPDPATHQILPLILYADRTGIDANQHYDIEPWLFSFANFTTTEREDRGNWRHICFVPNVKKDNDTTRRVQQYHKYLRFIISGIKACQQRDQRPTISLQIGGDRKDFILYFPIIAVLGDQLSQDTLCRQLYLNNDFFSMQSETI